MDNAALGGERVLGWAFATTHLSHYQPLSWLAWAALRRGFGLSPAAHHLASLLLHLLAAAATDGRRPGRTEIEKVGLLGRRAAESGVSAGRGVSLYLSAARRVWAELPAVVRSRDRAAVRAAAEAVLQSKLLARLRQ